MPPVQFVVMAAAWTLWTLPFLGALLRPRERAAQVDARARWGFLLQSLAYCLLWVSGIWKQPPAVWRLGLAILFFALGNILLWTAIRALGKQWRIDAGLNADHELVRSGPYRIVRHPIYASMLCMFCGLGMLVASLPVFAGSLAIFLIGTEIRVRVEDALLASRFGGSFRYYRSHVAAYIPYAR